MNTRLLLLRASAVALLAVATAVCAADNGVLAAKAELKREPFLDAETIAKLPAETPVSIVERKGAWLRVDADSKNGWLRMLNVRTISGGGGKSGESGLGKAFNLAISGSTGSSVATGVRGLDKEQIAKAKPNAAELAKLDGYAVSAIDARSFASTPPPPLAEPKLDYLAK